MQQPAPAWDITDQFALLAVVVFAILAAASVVGMALNFEDTLLCAVFAAAIPANMLSAIIACGVRVLIDISRKIG